VGSALHVLWLNHLINEPALYTIFVLLAVAVTGVLAHRWMWRTLLDPATEFVVAQVRRESPTVTTVSLAARNGYPDDSWDFAPGQFAWLRLTRSVTGEEHPFTIASSPHLPGRVEFTIRNAGDFTRGINRLKPGQPVWVDGPHGSFTERRLVRRGRRHDRRRGRHHPDDEHGARGGRPPRPPTAPARRRRPQPRGPALPRRARLAARGSGPGDHRGAAAPPPRVGGPHGEINVGMLAAVLGTDHEPAQLDYFLCGPPGLIHDTLEALAALGVPENRVHTEQFDMA
jgi:3-phenylpropionate/trans-cinnamate dioxygenase ferredoxin reductase subunit